MQILLDYLVVSFKKIGMIELQEKLNLTGVKWEDGNSYYGYQHCYYYDSVKLHFGGKPDICLDLSGKGCRTIEHLNNLFFDWFEFLLGMKEGIQKGEIHVSRIDIACDDMEGYLNYDKMVKYIMQKRFICKSRKVHCRIGSERGIYCGSPQSERRLRIYDKAIEQGYPEGTHWLRTEFQLRNDTALSFLLNWFNVRDIGKTFFGVLHDYLRFITKPVNGENHSRAITCSWWLKFVQNAEKLKQLYCQGREYSLITIESYIEKCCSSNLLTMLTACGGNMQKLIDIIDNAKITKKQKKLLEEWYSCETTKL